LILTNFKDSIFLYLDKGYEKLDLEQRSWDGMTCLLLALSFPMGDTISNIFLKVGNLLDRGASASATDGNGKSCLHLLLAYDYQDYKYWDVLGDGEDKHSLECTLVELINAGADVHAVNHQGKTVSDVAREYNNGEFWKAALEEFGYNADEVMSWSPDRCAVSTATDIRTRFSSSGLARRKTFTREEFIEEDESVLEELEGSESGFSEN
jgi:ankyrin repeat protein